MSRSFAFAFALLLAVVFCAPLTAAQNPLSNGMVSKCKVQCTPAEVNGGQVKTGDEPVKVILYGHFEDILNRAPLNTQIPCSDCNNPESDLNRGYLTPVFSTYTNTDADFRFENNWFEMYSSAGLVEIVDGEWRTHQEPGLAEEVNINGDITLYFYLSAYPLPNQDSGSSPAGHNVLDVMPQVGVYARMDTGRFRFKGENIAEGDTGAGDTAGLAGSQGRVNIITTPGSAEDIYEFAVPMKVNKKTIPDVRSGTPGFIVAVNPYQIKGKQDSPIKDYQVMQSDWRVRVGPSTPPRLVFEVAKPMMTKAASLSIFNNAMFVRWSFVSPWGSYDVNEPTLKVELQGPTNPDPAKVGLSRPLIVKRSTDHDAHFKPVNATWKFDYQKAGLGDGEYTVHMEIMNLQGTYKLQENLKFTMKGGVPQDLQIIGAPPPNPGAAQAKSGGSSPGLAGVAAVAAMAVAALVLERRGRL
jgi:hypothetical protein